MFHDEPTIESLSMMGLAITSVGNHEFDEGKDRTPAHAERRLPSGRRLPGAASVHRREVPLSRRLHHRDGRPARRVFPPYEIREFEGIPVAFIGLTLKGTPASSRPSGVAGLEFRDEAETVNALVPELKARGVEAIVVLIHEGGYPTGDYNECPAISGPIVDIVKKFDRAVDVVDQRPHPSAPMSATSTAGSSPVGDKYGTLVTAIDLKLDPATRDIVSAKADNIIVRTNASWPRTPSRPR